MTRIGIRALRDNLTATIRRVRAGETFEVTHHGEPVAVLATVPTQPLTLPERVPNTSGRTTADILEELRADRV
jgi:prevent-host-death family protein